MSTFKTLFYKDLVASKKIIILFLIVGLYILLIGYLFRYSLIYGNNNDIVETEEIISTNTGISIIMMFLPTFIGGAIALNVSINTIFNERENRFFKFLFVTDISHKIYVKHKIIESIIVSIGCNLVSVFVNFIYLLQFFTKTNLYIFIFFSILGLVIVLVSLFTTPLALYFSNSKRTFSFITLGSVIVIVFVLICLFIKEGNMQDLINFANTIKNKFSLYAFLAFIIILVLGAGGTLFCYFTSCKVMEKRERLCLE